MARLKKSSLTIPATTRSRKKKMRMAKARPRRKVTMPSQKRCWAKKDLDCSGAGESTKCYTFPNSGDTCCLCQDIDGNLFVNPKDKQSKQHFLRNYGAHQKMGRGGFGLGGRAERGVGRGHAVGREYGQNGPKGFPYFYQEGSPHTSGENLGPPAKVKRYYKELVDLDNWQEAGRGKPVGRGYPPGVMHPSFAEYPAAAKKVRPIPGREYGDVGPGGEAGVQTVPWPWELQSRYPKTAHQTYPKTPRAYAYAGVQAVPWGSCGRKMAATSSAPEQAGFDASTEHQEPVYPEQKSGCSIQERMKSPMPYPDFSYRGIRGRTFGCPESDSPNCHSIKNAHDMEEYADKTCEMIEEFGAPPWIHQKISEIRQHVGDVKHYLEHEYGRNYGSEDHDWQEHGQDPNYIAHQNLYIIAEYSHYICSLLKDLDFKIPPWAADKLARARTSMGDVYHYIDYHTFAHEKGFI